MQAQRFASDARIFLESEIAFVIRLAPKDRCARLSRLWYGGMMHMGEFGHYCVLMALFSWIPAICFLVEQNTPPPPKKKNNKTNNNHSLSNTPFSKSISEPWQLFCLQRILSDHLFGAHRMDLH